MKKMIAAALLTAMLFALCACGGKDKAGAGESLDTSGIKTMADVFAIQDESRGYGYGEDSLAYMFEKDGRNYRVACDMTKDAWDKLDALDFFAEDHDEQVEAIFATLEVKSVFDIETIRPTEDDLKAWIGKTGKELEDKGFDQSGWYLGDKEATYYMAYGSFEYEVTFDGKVAEDDGETGYRPLKVKKIEVTGISDHVTDPDWEPEK